MIRSRPIVLAVSVLAASPAGANTADVFGLGPRSSAQAGAVAASVTDFSAVFYDPAGLAFGRGTQVGVGLMGFGSRLEIQGRPFGITDRLGLLVGVRAPVPLGGVLADRITFGLAFYILPSSLLRVISRYPQEPFFPLYDNRTQRLVVLPAIGVRLTDRLALGVGFNYLAGLSGAVQGTTGASRAIEPRVDEAIDGSLGIHAGVRWDPWPALSLAFAYRQSFSVPFSVASDVIVTGEPINLSVRSEGLYTPDELVWGVSYRPWSGTTVGLDVTWARWSGWGGPYIHVESVLPLAGELVGELPVVPFDDIVTCHAGLEQLALRTRAVELTLRAGYGFDPSPVPKVQPGVTNLIDGPKHIVGLGAGLRLTRLLPTTLTLDASFGLHVVVGRTYTKHVFAKDEDPVPFDGLRDEVKDVAGEPATWGLQISNPGYPSIHGGGWVWAASVLVGVEL